MHTFSVSTHQKVQNVHFFNFFPRKNPLGVLKIEVYPMGKWISFLMSACLPDSNTVEILKIWQIFNSLPYLHMGLRDLTSTPYNVLINSNMVLWVKYAENLWKLEYFNTFSYLGEITVLKCKKRLPKNVENLIHHMGAQMGGSRFEFFRFIRCCKMFPAVSCHRDFTTVKYANLLSEIGFNTFWDVVPKL